MIANTIDGHGTPVAGVIAQFVPQATIVPVDIFLPFNAGVSLSLSGSATGGSRRRHGRRRRCWRWRRWRRLILIDGNHQRPHFKRLAL